MKASEVINLIKGQSKYPTPTNSVNHSIPSYGLSYPQMNGIAKQIKNPFEFLDSNTSEVYELHIIHTMVLKRVKDIDLAIHYFKVYCNIAKEWSVVDSLCQRFVIAKVYPKQVFDVLVELSSSSDEFVQRCVAVMCLSHFLNDEYINKVVSLLLKLKCKVTIHKRQ
ncbi:MAG: DNA alkylation repair protein [Erysipelotrichaceae bacterium]|nr:DNA alkylation repair protein [Erysipelotrichaceae bacterium]